MVVKEKGLKSDEQTMKKIRNFLYFTTDSNIPSKLGFSFSLCFVAGHEIRYTIIVFFLIYYFLYYHIHIYKDMYFDAENVRCFQKDPQSYSIAEPYFTFKLSYFPTNTLIIIMIYSSYISKCKISNLIQLYKLSQRLEYFYSTRGSTFSKSCFV